MNEKFDVEVTEKTDIFGTFLTEATSLRSPSFTPFSSGEWKSDIKRSVSSSDVTLPRSPASPLPSSKRAKSDSEFPTMFKPVSCVRVRTTQLKEQTFDEAASFAESLRAQMFEDAHDKRKVFGRLINSGLAIQDGSGYRVKVDMRQLAIAAGDCFPAHPCLANGETRPRLADAPAGNDDCADEAVFDNMLVSKETAPTARAMTVLSRAPEDLALAIQTSTRALFDPPIPRNVSAVGRHTCDAATCRFVPLTDMCGWGGCEAATIRLQKLLEPLYTKEERAMIRPRDVWTCVTSGTPHVCTLALCDALAPDAQCYRLCCQKTGLGHMAVRLPAADALFGGDFRPTASVDRKCMDDYISSMAAGGAGGRRGRGGRGIDHATGRRRRARRLPPGKRSGKVTGVTANIVAVTLRERATEVFGCTDPTLISATESARADVLAETEARLRASELMRVFAHAQPLTPPGTRMVASLAGCYAKAVEMATVAVVLLPAVMKMYPLLSPERRTLYAKKYGMFIWRGWTLVAGLPHAEILDAEVKFRHFSLGMLYQAKYGLALEFDVTTVPEYRDSPQVAEAVRAAVRGVLRPVGAPDPARRPRRPVSDERLMKVFARRHAITFLRQDKCLASRLVQENKIGTRNTVVDGIQVESVGVNAGISLVKKGFADVAEWSKREFVLDVAVRGVTPCTAIQSAVQRAIDYFLVTT